MDYHTIVKQEINAAMETVVLLNQKIDELTAQRFRFAAFVSAMEIALPHIPQQLELKLVDPIDLVTDPAK
jgi:hypothetical protein